ncbi:hypothetical protein CKF54_02330 [Psittacicella hinzii]|uniref:Transglycosylase SLT domain-containing protein n=1 Tax=Psittacicella hinzii TaxID=2028575 RepID=A0A3A1Y651_9GAMM|nr:transglycosylase SLT domain-containing protein [Psittacicella hinzii]RIY33733.1 hypothetical protein CKF54_02330 [Psittacicella hinzii]
MNFKKLLSLSTLPLFLSGLVIGVAQANPILNYSELKLSNSYPIKTSNSILYENTLNFVNNQKALNAETKAELDGRLSALENYVLYPILLAEVIKKFPFDYPLNKYLDLYLTYFPSSNFTISLVGSVFYTESNNGDYYSILSQYQQLGENYPYNLVANCALLDAQINSNVSYNKTKLKDTISQALEYRYINSCKSLFNTYASYNLVDTEDQLVVKQFIVNNSSGNNIKLLDQVSSLINTDDSNIALYDYVKVVNDTPAVILENRYKDNKYYREVDQKNLRNLAKMFGFQDDNSYLDYISYINSSNMQEELKEQAIVEYADLYYYKISASTLNNFIAKYHNDRILELNIRRAILNKQDYLAYINLLSEEKQNSAEWLYWKAKALESSNPRQAKALFDKVLNTQGFYGMLAAKTLNKPYKIINSLVYKLDKAPDLSHELPWYYTAIKEADSLNNSSLALLLWRNLETDKDYTGLINWSYENNLYYLGVNSSIRQGLRDNLVARFPDAFSSAFASKTKNLSVTKTFAQAIARQESAWNYNAVSSAKAYGLMQFINATAKKTASNMGLTYTSYKNLFDPQYSISLGTYHLSELLDSNDNNRALAAIGYNAGPRRISQWLNNANGRLNFDEFVATIPFTETRNYVMNTIAFDYYNQIIQGNRSPVTIYDHEWNRKY